MIHRTKMVTFRVTELEFKKLKQAAKNCAEGDLSEYIRWCLFNSKIIANKKGSKKDPPHELC